MKCPECGSETADSAVICTACGAPLSAASRSEEGEGAGASLPPPPPVSGASRGRMFLRLHFERILLVAGILFIGLGTFFVWLVNPKSPAQSAIRQLDHTNPFVTLVLTTICGVIIATIISAQRGRLPFIRRISGLDAIDEAVGRATEMGRPILFSPGLRGLDIVTLQALAVASHVARTAVRYGTRMIIPVCDSQIMPITQEVMREVHSSEGRLDSFRPEDVRYLSERQFAYAAGVTGILHREKVAASFLFGQFFAESLILAENGQAVGAIQVAGTPDLLQIPFFVVTCDYTIIGDEYYAASAYLSREPTLLGSLVGQDIAKALFFILLIVGMVWTSFTLDNPLMKWLVGGGG